ncbi:hypothetical protein N7456_009599 [Penicillium angulare]|uniref:DUF7730 domain-containing protein n=1 Tax=Penicillium angulare TaxID=116970 RepID=A0A9W9F4Y5_9EURO|nr:hypothetical protein N7456_009599 [Penicillium angulare]
MTATDPDSDIPKPFPAIRRSLTPLECSEVEPPSGWRKVMRKPKLRRSLHQYQSPLAGLPPEIRWMIWEYYFCAPQIHVVRIDRGHSRALNTRLAAIKCAEGRGSDKAESFCNHLCWGKIPCTRTFHDAVSPKDPRWYLDECQAAKMEAVGFVALLQTCRLIFDHADSIIGLSNTLLRKRLDQIRSIRFTYHFPYNPYGYVGDLYVDWRRYCSACEVLARMSQLEELIIHLHPENLGPNAAAFIVRPLVQIKQPKLFTVHMFVPEGYAEPQFDDSELPFKLIIRNDTEGCGQRRLV